MSISTLNIKPQQGSQFDSLVLKSYDICSVHDAGQYCPKGESKVTESSYFKLILVVSLQTDHYLIWNVSYKIT